MLGRVYPFARTLAYHANTLSHCHIMTDARIPPRTTHLHSDGVSEQARAIASELLSEGQASESISLDRVAEVIGAAPVTMQDIEAILDALSAAGRPAQAEMKDPPAALARVLKAVRSFSAATGRRPTLPEIAQHSGLTLAEVRFALLYARVLVR